MTSEEKKILNYLYKRFQKNGRKINASFINANELSKKFGIKYWGNIHSNQYIKMTIGSGGYEFIGISPEGIKYIESQPNILIKIFGSKIAYMIYGAIIIKTIDHLSKLLTK